MMMTGSNADSLARPVRMTEDEDLTEQDRHIKMSDNDRYINISTGSTVELSNVNWVTEILICFDLLKPKTYFMYRQL